MKHDRRSQDRQRCNISIKIIKPQKSPEHNAVILNQGGEGMYLETDRNLYRGDHLMIQMPVSDNSKPENDNVSAVKIMWNQKNKNNGKCCAGAKIIEKASCLSCSENTKAVYFCDSCGCAMKELLETDDFLQLCPGCFYDYTKLNEGKLKNDIKRFLLGNVI